MRVMNSLRNLGTSTPTATFMGSSTGSLRRVCVADGASAGRAVHVDLHVDVERGDERRVDGDADGAQGSSRPQPPRCGEVVS